MIRKGVEIAGYITLAPKQDGTETSGLLLTLEQLPAEKIFTAVNTTIMLLVIWAYGFAWLVAYMVPDLSLLYYIWAYKWDYDTTDLSFKALNAEFISDMFNTVGMVVWYGSIMIKLRIKTNTISVMAQANNKNELKVLIQAMLLCLMIILTEIFLFLFPLLFVNKWTNLVAGLTWLICAGNNSIIYISLNRVKFNYCYT
uniref:7TM GPCR serpentine receptor class x (Srx) domain-containing protein n=1 Tax=Romanomermis culicivorax TaxID=13658 RepID=A0A915JK14_ROMCU